MTNQELFESIQMGHKEKKVLSLSKKLVKKCSFNRGSDVENLCHLAYWLYVYGCEDEALKLCEITHEVEFPGKGVWNVWDRILLMWGLEVQIYKNRNMTEKADELIRQMDNLWRFPPTLPPADSELEAERRNRFTVEFCSYKENIREWINNVQTVDDAITVLNQRIVTLPHIYVPYMCHIRAFLYAKNNDIDNAIESIKQGYENSEIPQVIIDKLVQIANG